MNLYQQDIQPQHPYTIHASPGDPWYVTFTDKQGVEWFLPVRKKFLGKWKEKDCPKVEHCRGHRFDVYFAVDNGLYDAETVLSAFVEKYPTPQDYLNYINNT